MIRSLILAVILGTAITLPQIVHAGKYAVDGLQPRLDSEKLGGNKRYLLYASTDKPIYREGETAYFRVVALNAADNTPLRGSSPLISFVVKDPKGAVITKGRGQITDSSAGLKWTIPSSQAGGVYSATFSCPQLGTPETTRKFEVRAYRAPRIKTQIEFLRKGYGPGDTVTAELNAKRAEGGIPAGAKVTATARVDGKAILLKNLSIDKKGNCSVNFKLPETIKTGDGTLNFVIADGGVIESAAKTIPILLPNINIVFYPESGDSVLGFPCRVYVQANRRDGKPADLEGSIVIAEGKDKGRKVSLLKTVHEGRGIFSYTPKAGEKFALKLDKPSGIDKLFPLPDAKLSGAIIRTDKKVYQYADKIMLHISATADSNIDKITVSKRENELDSKTVAAGTDQPMFLDPKDAEGVLILTAWNKNGIPLAERLVFRQPKFKIHTVLNISKKSFIPGEKVKIDILTTDENGKPVEAVVGLTVTDDAVLEMIEKREQAPRLPTMVYLENEVKDLADAHIFLNDKNPKSMAAIDLLLGTQGWRRFVLVQYDKIKANDPNAAKRIMAESTPSRPRPQEFVFAVKAAEIEGVENIRRERKAIIRKGAKPKFAKPAKIVAQRIAKPQKELHPLDLKQDRKAPDVRKKEEARPQVFLADKAMMREAPMFIVVREYAHKVRPNRKANDRVDFTETLYWNAGIRTGARDGKATLEFDLSDSVTSFRVMADAFGNNGALGIGDAMLKSVEPFYIEPKMPLSATVGDVLEIPVAIVNASNNDFDSVPMTARCKDLKITQAPDSALKANQRLRRLVTVIPDRPGSYKLVFSASAGSYTDTNTRTLKVSPKGFPISSNKGGLIDSKHPASFTITIPQKVIPESLSTTAKIYPSPLANMEEALNALLRQPSGCFEQTSSTNYPLVMAQQYFKSHHGVSPERISKANALLEKGYKKLTGFECKQKGYEWFGGDPGHEALTAYGLMEFVDMKKVMSVDNSMIQRTREWLLKRRDSKGGFKRNKRALDSFGRAPQPTTNAYIVWALLESGQSPDSLKKEIEAVKKEAIKSKDSYIIALAANIMYLAGDTTTGDKLCEELVKAVQKDGHVGNGKTSITCSGGNSLALETTAFSILAWLKNDKRWAPQVEESMPWLFAQCKAGRFGSTQSTILVLKAINAYDAARAKPMKDGSVILKIDGHEFGHPVRFSKDSKGAIELPDFSTKMTSGEHKIELVMSDGSKMPYAVEISYYANVPASDSKCLLKLSNDLSSNQVVEGEILELNVNISVGDKDAPTPVAIIGIPAGLELRHDQLKELVSAKRIDSYEVFGSSLVLYWRALRSNESRSIPVSLTASIPGEYTGPASSAYLYYTDESKCWIPGVKVKITAKN